MNREIGFVIVIEPGDLEQKTCLLVESLCKFGGIDGSQIWVVQPRKGGGLSQKTLSTLAKNKIHFIYSNLNENHQQYPYANKIYASAFIEKIAGNFLSTLCFLDSDILCLGCPRDLILSKGVDVALRPVDNKGIGIHKNQPLNNYWQTIFKLSNSKGQIDWEVKTSINKHKILPYFNAGVIAVNPKLGVFQTWLEYLKNITTSENYEEFTDQQKHNLDQALLAAVVLEDRPTDNIRILDVTYNYPLHYHNTISSDSQKYSFDDLVLVHYHNEFYSLNWMASVEIGDIKRRWLKERLPLNRSYTLSYRDFYNRGFFHKLVQKILDSIKSYFLSKIR